MENFTNETIDTTQLPKFEEVVLSKLHPAYWKIILIQIALVFIIISVGFVLLVNNAEETIPFQWQIGLGILCFSLLVVLFFQNRIQQKMDLLFASTMYFFVMVLSLPIHL